MGTCRTVECATNSIAALQYVIASNVTRYELVGLLPGEHYRVTLQASNLAGGRESSINFSQPTSGQYTPTAAWKLLMSITFHSSVPHL
jgi:hypothetical protein